MAVTTITKETMATSPPAKDPLLGGKVPLQKLTREQLLKTHRAHVEKQDLAPDAPRPVKQPVMAEAYPACTKSIKELEIIPLSDLRVETHHRGQAVIVKIISAPFIGAGSVSIVEDEFGNVDKIAIYNQGDTSILSGVPEGCFVAIKEPYYIYNNSPGASGEALDFMICVDHPSDVVLLRFTDPIIPESLRLGPILQTADDWRNAGDKAFLEKDYPTAIFCYTEGLEACDPSTPSDDPKRRSIHTKRSGTNLLLGRYDAAKSDAIASLTGSPNADWKAHFNAGRASYGLCDYPSAKEHLTKAVSLLNSSTSPNPSSIAVVQKELTRTESRLNEETTGDYPFTEMLSLLLKQGTNPTPHLDRGSFLLNTTIQPSPHHGRGLFAARDLSPGDLVLVEKASLMPNQYSPTRASAALYASMIRQMCDNPSLCASILPLHPGDDLPYSYPENSPSPGDIIDSVPIIDIFQAEGIRSKNCFSLPLATVLATRPSMPDNLLAKGLWIHTSYMNHSCVPNTMRSFMGDLLISRATRHIKKGEEIFQQYCPIKPFPEVRQKQFVDNWGFTCTCVLCSSEQKSSATNFAKRNELVDKIDKICGKHKILDNIAVNKGIESKDIIPDAAIRNVDRLMRQLEDLHEQEIYDGHHEEGVLIPRLMLIYPTNWLISAHRGRKNWSRVVKYSIKVLRNFGFRTIRADQEKSDRIEGVEWEPMGLWDMDGEKGQGKAAGLMTVHVVAALRRLAEAYESLGRKEMARRCEEAARFGYMVVCGFEADLGNLDM
ncbi:hypothetical protein V8F33_007558 [Rhypophila sp. PSN 637]